MRAPRFSLRLLFILTTLCAAVLGYIVWFEAPCHNPRQREQEQLVEELSSLGLDQAIGRWRILPSPPFAKLLGRKQGRRLKAVHLCFDCQVKVRPQGITSLMERIDQEFNIETIRIEFRSYRAVNEAFHCEIPRRTTHLVLDGVEIDQSDIETIAGLKHLKRIVLSEISFETDNFRESLRLLVSKLPASLEELLLPRCSISPTDLQSLAKLKSLRELTITCDGPKISHDDVRRLSKKLTALELDTDIPEQWLAALADHSQLEVITIHTDQKMPDTICDSILEINPKNFRDLGGMLSATAVRRLWDAGIEVNGPQQ